MTKFEKLVYVGCPWLFGTVMVISGLYISFTKPAKLIGILMSGFGLICMSLYCICALLVKIIEAK